MRQITVPAARRIALAAQGFADPRPAGRHDVRHLRRVVDRVSVVQLDSVNVFARAHYMPFLSRIGWAEAARIDRHLNDGAAHFEYWGHQASVMPVEMYPLFRWKMAAFAADPWPAIRRVEADRPGFVERTFEAVAERGPLSIGDLDDVGTRYGGWWRSEGRIVLEWLFATGRLTGWRRPDFARVYDLPERRLPAAVLGAPAVDEVLAYGTQVVWHTVDTPEGPKRYWRKLRVYATSYSAARAGVSPDVPWYGITRTGMKMRRGIVAVDPRLIPLRTDLFVPGYGVGIAGDTGGGIKRYHIDLGFDDDNYESWHRHVDLYLLEPLPPERKMVWILP
jgi:3D (Asp-Asp-Asp) domain-containing protein